MTVVFLFGTWRGAMTFLLAARNFWFPAAYGCGLLNSATKNTFKKNSGEIMSKVSAEAADFLIETITLQDVVSTGRLKIENVGPVLVRLIFYVQKSFSDDTPVNMPVASIIIPRTSVMPLANKLAAAQALARSDLIGIPIGTS